MDIVQKIYSSLIYSETSSAFFELQKNKYAVIKGEPLSMLIYGVLNMRKSTDVDVLTLKSEMGIIQTKFKNIGFQEKNLCRRDKITSLCYSHQPPPLIKKTNIVHLTIDVNFDILWGEYEGKRIDIEEFLSDTIEMEIYGVKVKTLPPIKAMIQLILHHYKDMNSIFLLATRKSIKYDMFKDIYYLLRNNLDTIPLDKLYAMSAEYEIIPYVFYVLYYTGQVFDDEILKQYMEAFRTPEGEAFLNCYGLCAKERKEWKCDFKTRLDADNLYDLIKDDLTEKDREKIAINKRIFMGVSE
jgi:hypothetical protein